LNQLLGVYKLPFHAPKGVLGSGVKHSDIRVRPDLIAFAERLSIRCNMISLPSRVRKVLVQGATLEA